MELPLLVSRPDSGLGNIRSSPAAPSRNIDYILLMCQAVLTVAGTMVVYSASRTRFDDSPYFFVTRQVIFAIFGAVVMTVIMAIDYEWFKEKAYFFYGVTLLGLALLLALGRVTGRGLISFDLGPINFQPAELAKFTTLMALSAFLVEHRDDAMSYIRFLGGLVIVGIPSVLIIGQPDLGSASVIVTIAMGVLLVAGARPSYILLISGLSVVTVAAAFVTGLVSNYQKERLTVFLGQNTDSDAVYQVRNAIRALGTGGVSGKGWLRGPLTNDGEIPLMWADFPFAAVGEQFGLIGCVALLSVFMVALGRIWRIASLSRDLFGTYVCAGVFTMLLWQVFQNVGMTLGIMPVTGLPLPFISYGGSGMVIYATMFGMVQSVHMRRMR